MLYATIDKQRWDSLPAEWDEVQDMFKYLQRMTYGIQLNMERRMLYDALHSEYRAVLIRWARTSTEKPREILLETDDPAQMKATLFMLINEAEIEYKAAKSRMMSWVP